MDRPNSINVALIGEVSSGKTTLVNSIFCKTFGNMKRTKTTLSVNIYCETSDPDLVDSTEIIFQKNSEFEKLMKNKKMMMLEEKIYYVPPSISFGDQINKHGFNLNIIDIPGLNDDSDDAIIYDWIHKNFHKFDIVIFVIDGEIGLNTISEQALLNFIVTNIENYPHIKLINVLNKYDEPDNDELIELKEQTIKAISDATLGKSIDFVIIPMSAERANLYRYIEHNASLDGMTKKHKMLLTQIQLGAIAKKYDDFRLLKELVASIEITKNDPTSPYNSTNYNALIEYFQQKVTNQIDSMYYNKIKCLIDHVATNQNISLKYILGLYNTIYKLHHKIENDDVLLKLFTKYIEDIVDNYKLNESLDEYNRLLRDNGNVLLTLCDESKIRDINKKLFKKCLFGGYEYGIWEGKNHIYYWFMHAQNNVLLNMNIIVELMTFYFDRLGCDECDGRGNCIDCGDYEFLLLTDASLLTNDMIKILKYIPINCDNLIDVFLERISIGINDNEIKFKNFMHVDTNQHIMLIIIKELVIDFPFIRKKLPKFYMQQYLINLDQRLGNDDYDPLNGDCIDTVQDLIECAFPEIFTLLSHVSNVNIQNNVQHNVQNHDNNNNNNDDIKNNDFENNNDVKNDIDVNNDYDFENDNDVENENKDNKNIDQNLGNDDEKIVILW